MAAYKAATLSDADVKSLSNSSCKQMDSEQEKDEGKRVIERASGDLEFRNAVSYTHLDVYKRQAKTFPDYFEQLARISTPA